VRGLEHSNISWFRESFGEEYRTLYCHRDDDEARILADLIRSRASYAKGGCALDVACGAGRHLPFFTDCRWTVGIDLSAPLLRIARSTNRDALLVMADMRALPLRSNQFDLVINLFTSFGYFCDDAQNGHVIGEIARVTMRGGVFVLDFFNAVQVRRALVHFDRRQIGSMVVEQKRKLSADGRYVKKDISIVGTGRMIHESVRLFELGELLAMLHNYGFTVGQVFGDYFGGPLTSTSPRTILIGRRL
jgi:SAM-dependent methyltransferase